VQRVQLELVKTKKERFSMKDIEDIEVLAETMRDIKALAETIREARGQLLLTCSRNYWIDYGIPEHMDYVVVKGCPNGILISPQLIRHPDWQKFISLRDIPHSAMTELDVSRLRMRPPQLLPVSETDWSDHIVEL